MVFDNTFKGTAKGDYYKVKDKLKDFDDFKNKEQKCMD